MSNPPSSSPAPQAITLRRLVHEAVAPYAGRFAVAGVCMVLVAVSTAAQAWLMEPVVTEVFVERRAELLWPVGLAVFASFAVRGVATYGQSVIMTRAGQSILTDLQNRLFTHFLHLDLGFFAVNRTGALISRLTTDINAMRLAVSTALTAIGRESLSVVLLVAVMFYQDWRLAAVALVAFPATVIPISRIGRRLRKVTANTQQETGSYMTLVEQSLSGIRLVKAYRMEDYESSRAAALTRTVRNLIFKAERVRAMASPLMETFGGVAVTIVIVYGGWRVIEGHTTAGAFFSFITALLSAYRPMKALANVSANINEGLAGADRLFAVLDTKPTIVDRPDAVPLHVTDGTVTFTNVGFAYEDRNAVLEGLNLSAATGKTTALVGPSGAGKSTILNLIPRFYDVTAGVVRIDGQDVREVSLASLRDAIAFVGQDAVLFDDTVAANIRFGRPDADGRAVEKAAMAAGAHDFITALPQGYKTFVGERGQSLSGGQRQRIAIARALLRDAPILLLDEATSALDMETERQVQTALDRLKQGRTTIVIAHRLSTVASADHIFVIDHGQVVETGTHATLVAQNGMYARLQAMQFVAVD